MHFFIIQINIGVIVVGKGRKELCKAMEPREARVLTMVKKSSQVRW